MRRFSLFHPLWLSFYSEDIYIDVRKNWNELIFAYLLILLAGSWIPFSIQLDNELVNWVDRSAPDLVEQFPDMTFENGKVSIAANGPVFIRTTETDEIFMIIDITGEYTSLDNLDAGILVKQSEILVRQGPDDVQTLLISDLFPPDGEQFILNKELIYQWLELIKSSLIYFLHPILTLISFIYRIIQVLIYAVIGLLIVQQFKKEMDYTAMVRLAIVAITPAIILDMINSMMAVQMVNTQFWWLICFLISMGYLYFGIKVNVTTPEEEIATIQRNE